MGVVVTKPKAYSAIPLNDASNEFSSINIHPFQQKNGVPVQPSVQKNYWNRVFASNKGSG